MTYGFLDTLTTPAGRAAQDANCVGGFWEEMEVDLPQDRFTEREAAFIAARDSFYMASISESGLAEYPALRRAQGLPAAAGRPGPGFTEFAGNRQ
jgi:hypothetical protein